ncbi:phosphoribosyltransferase [Agrobacterium tumefaciens]|uniref:phosphoribosyltransferase n=1 Tax=Agrobacterium tumefaciens TaxID=358 RepID=UPI002863B7EE|nr:phosphoribosyltransferase [Agrobacterium tumefaciens]MDR6589537.1 pyrimidine operon attenuation protein/uracil phosphoribosyltransferase [Agrobacterium tumefaciens]
MPQIEIDCLLRHCTDPEIKRENAEWQAYHAVRAIKGETLRGTFNFQISGRGGVNIGQSNVQLFLEDACYRAATRIREKYGKEICIVPVPNSEGIFGSKAPFRTLKLAQRVATLVGSPAQAQDIIRWKEKVGKTHLGERTRSVDAHKNLIKLNGKTEMKVVILDDVVTSGSQLAAAKVVLEDAGMAVAGLCAFAEVLDKGQRSDPPSWKMTARNPYSINDAMDNFLSILG